MAKRAGEEKRKKISKEGGRLEIFIPGQVGPALSEVSMRGSHWLDGRDGGLCKLLSWKYIMPSPFRFGKGQGDR